MHMNYHRVLYISHMHIYYLFFAPNQKAINDGNDVSAKEKKYHLPAMNMRNEKNIFRTCGRKVFSFSILKANHDEVFSRDRGRIVDDSKLHNL
jgi:hypothetical protein